MLTKISKVTEEYPGRPIPLKTVVTATTDSARDVAERHLAALDESFADYPAVASPNAGMVHIHPSGGQDRGCETTCNQNWDGPTWQSKHRYAVAMLFVAHPIDLPS